MGPRQYQHRRNSSPGLQEFAPYRAPDSERRAGPGAEIRERRDCRYGLVDPSPKRRLHRDGLTAVEQGTIHH